MSYILTNFVLPIVVAIVAYFLIALLARLKAKVLLSKEVESLKSAMIDIKKDTLFTIRSVSCLFDVSEKYGKVLDGILDALKSGKFNGNITQIHEINTEGQELLQRFTAKETFGACIDDSD